MRSKTTMPMRVFIIYLRTAMPDERVNTEIRPQGSAAEILVEDAEGAGFRIG
jgi:hypothetical protein